MTETPMLSIGMLNDGYANSVKIQEVGIGIVLHNASLKVIGNN